MVAFKVVFQSCDTQKCCQFYYFICFSSFWYKYCWCPQLDALSPQELLVTGQWQKHRKQNTHRKNYSLANALFVLLNKRFTCHNKHILLWRLLKCFFFLLYLYDNFSNAEQLTITFPHNSYMCKSVKVKEGEDEPVVDQPLHIPLSTCRSTSVQGKSAIKWRSKRQPSHLYDGHF